MIKRISFLKFSFIASIVGFLIPFLWIVFWRISNQWFPAIIEVLMSTVWVNNILLFFWPSSIFMIGDPNDSNYALLAFSVFLNVIFYFILGSLFWKGVYGNRLFILPAIGVLFSVWLYMVNI